MKLKRILWTLILGLSTTFVAWYGLYPWLRQQQPIKPIAPEYTLATVLTPTQALNDFTLINSNGQPYTNACLLGNWTLMFFGYSRCPDICPSTLMMITQLFRDYDKLNNKTPLSFVFVSLDPQADTPESLHQFVTKFDPTFLGLTGDVQEINLLAKSCRVHSFPEPSSNISSQKIDHSASLLLINPEGRLQAVFSPPYTALGIARDIHTLIHRISASKT